jgi:anti-sigma B factor antagonist
VPVLQTKIRTSPIGVGCHAVLVAGDLDADVAPRLRACLTELLESGANKIVVDLFEVTFMDSTGLGMLAATGKLLREAGGELVLVADSPSMLELLRTTGTGRLCRLETSLLGAVDHVVQRRN